MRLYFRFDLEFTYFGHAMATWFKRDRGMSDGDFRGMVGGRLYHEFLLSGQSEIRYSHLSTYQDLMWRAQTESPDLEFLARMERELGVDTLWRLLDADRSIKHFTHEQALSAMTIFLRYFWDEFTNHRPDAVISFTTSNLSALACWYVARRLGIPYLEQQHARLRKRALIADDPIGTFPQVDRRYRRALNGDVEPGLLAKADEHIEAFRSQPEMLDGLTRATYITEKRTSIHPRRLIGFGRVLYFWWFGQYRKDIVTEPPLRQAADTVRMNMRRRRLFGGSYFENTVPGERYVYYGLAHQPEMTTMILAPFWQDQPALIENIARSLPLDMKLYVKEHIPMLGVRPLGYYERIKGIPNVRLVHPYTHSLSLVQGAAAIATITGTIGWEALMLGVPVVTFGDVFYNAIDCVQRCRAIEDLPAILRRAIDERVHDPKQVRAYVAALMAESFPLDNDQLYDPTRGYASISSSAPAQVMYREYANALDRTLAERASTTRDREPATP